jgi:hypothetical protein
MRTIVAATLLPAPGRRIVARLAAPSETGLARVLVAAPPG